MQGVGISLIAIYKVVFDIYGIFGIRYNTGLGYLVIARLKNHVSRLFAKKEVTNSITSLILKPL